MHEALAASFQLHNWWHGLGVVGHIVLVAVLALVITAIVIYLWRD